MLLELNPAAGCIVSGEIGVDFISVICANFAVEVIWRHKESTDRDMGQPTIMDRCGNRGCWETQVSQSAVFRCIQRAINQGRASVLSEMTGGDLDRLTVPMVVDGAGDAVALETLEVVGHHLGIGIASLVNALNPDLVVFGGILSLAGEFLLPVVHEELQRRALHWNRSATQVVLARHGFDACIGGVAKAILAQPSTVAG